MGQTEWKDTLKEYMDREAFAYDPNRDENFLAYADLMRKQGKSAMEDTMGRAASMTGGYGNSYAATAGQQVYNQYLDEIDSKAIDYRQLAREEYDAEGADLLNKIALAQNNEDRELAAEETAYNKALSVAQLTGDYTPIYEMLGMTDEDIQKAAAYQRTLNEEEELGGRSAMTADHYQMVADAINQNGQAGYEAVMSKLAGMNVNTDGVDEWLQSNPAEIRYSYDTGNDTITDQEWMPYSERSYTLAEKGGGYIGQVNDNAVYEDQYGNKFTGVQLLSYLQSFDRMSEDAAKNWMGTYLKTDEKEVGHKY